MARHHESGIPHRLGACFCEIGKSRQELGIDDATETTSEWDNIVGNAPRDPKHTIYAVSYFDQTDSENGKLGYSADGINDDATTLGCAIVPWGSYPTKTGVDDPNPELIVKIKRDITETDSDVLFPKITLTLRPYYNRLDYQYTGNANFSGEGEIGFESLDTTRDLYAIAYWNSGNAIPKPTDWNDYSFRAGSEQYNANQQAFVEYCVDHGDEDRFFKPLTLQEIHYWKSKDKPSETPNPWEPLKDWDIEPNLYPRLPSEPEYNFLRNESYDFRYRYPSDYFTKYGSLNMSYDQYDSPQFFIAYSEIPDPNHNDYSLLYGVSLGTWTWALHQQDPNNPINIQSSNPEFEPNDDQYFSDEGIAPIIKGWYWDSPTPPATNNGLYSLVASQNYKTVKKIRKRYAYSFRAEGYGSWVPSLYVFDHYNANTDGNVLVFWNDFNIENQYWSAFPATYECNPQKVVNAGYLASSWGNQDNWFNCDSVWALEVNCKLEDWNFKEQVTTDQISGKPKTVYAGVTIKGYIRLGVMILEPSYSKVGLMSGVFTDYYTGFEGINSWISPSVVFRTKRRTYGFDENGRQLWESIRLDGGTIEWSITLTAEHAKGKPVKIKELDIAPNGDFSRLDKNTLCYISDFVVTEVIPP